MTTHDFTALPDLASRTLGGSVSAANDELFAERENLIKAGAPFFDPNEFGHKGKVYDGWETRRRRDNGHDYAIARLGTPGISTESSSTLRISRATTRRSSRWRRPRSRDIPPSRRA